MDKTTASATYSSRSNAKQRAEKMITAGTSPAVDYTIKPVDDGRFAIVWKTHNGATTTEQGFVEAPRKEVTYAHSQQNPCRSLVGAQPRRSCKMLDCQISLPRPQPEPAAIVPADSETRVHFHGTLY